MAATEGAEVTDVRKYKFVECRALGHAWKKTQVRKVSWGFGMSLECTRCGCVRTDTIDSRGEVSTRRYDQPEGYKNPEIPERSNYRRELVRRTIKETQ